MTEPDFPYDKKPNEPLEIIGSNPTQLPVESPNQPPLNPLDEIHKTFICPKCKKVFNTKEELTIHLETVHQSPKKQI